MTLENKAMLEKQIELRGCTYAKNRGIEPYKFTSPNRAAVPDRLNLAVIPEELRDLIGKYVCFIEYKKEGVKPTQAQMREHTRLRNMGFRVEVVDSVELAKSIIDSMG